MSVKTKHKDYLAREQQWKRCRDASAGRDAIYDAGERYLAKLPDQSQPDYDAYRGRATFFNATWRTISGLQGMMFRQPPEIKISDEIKPYMNDITLSGVPTQIFMLKLTEEILTVGRVGIMVDYPQVENVASMTLADAITANLRPMMKQYVTESILNWDVANINNAVVLSQVRLQECVKIYSNEFTFTEKTVYRVLDLVKVPSGPDGTETRVVYRVRMFEIKTENGIEEDVCYSTVFPMINNDFLSYIPFYFISTDDVDPDVDIPPLMDLVDMNISHYKTTADYEHGCHFTGLPTPVISGYTPENSDAKFGIGSMTAWVFPRVDAKAFYLEFTGQGLASLEKNIAAKEQRMAVLGARMLEAQPTGTESADTAGIHRSGEQSTLASIAQAASIGFTLALRTFCSFAGTKDVTEVSADINRDFFPPIIDALTLTALIAGWQNGAYGYESLFNMLKQNEIVPLEKTVEEEIASMKLHPPLIPGGTQVNQAGKTPIENPTQRQLQTP